MSYNLKYIVKVKFTKEFTDGTLKRVTEPYLLEASCFTDAEGRIFKEVGEYVRGEFIVQAMSKIDVSDIFFYDDSDTWFKVKIQFVTTDADSGKEIKQSNTYFLTAHTTAEANQRIIDSLSGLLVSYDITSVVKTQIVDYFPYLPEETYKNEEE